MLRIIKTLCLLVLCLSVSCSENNLNIEKDYKRYPGKYLSEIKKDSLKVADFEYDDNRYLKKINLYLGTYLKTTYEYLYNENGQVVQENINYLLHDIAWQHNYTYENRKLISKKTYKIQSGNKIPMSKTLYILDKNDNSITCNYYPANSDSLNKSELSDVYYYDPKGNLYKAHLNIGSISENIQEYTYDNKFSPFYNLFIPYLKLDLALLDRFECWSASNMTECKTTWIGEAKNYSENGTYSISYKYEGNYPVDIEDYYTFKYIDLP